MNFIMSGTVFPHNVKNPHMKQVSGQSSSAPSTPTVIPNRQNITGKSKTSPNTNSSSNKVSHKKSYISWYIYEEAAIND